MKTPRSLSTRLVLTLALGCALLILAPPPRAHAQMSPALLTMDTVDKMIAFGKAMKADPALREEFNAPDDSHLEDTLEHGGSINAPYAARCPKAAAAMKNAGLTPDEFFKTYLSLMAASMAADGQLPVDDKAPDAKTLRANVEFVKAHKEHLAALMQ